MNEVRLARTSTYVRSHTALEQRQFFNLRDPAWFLRDGCHVTRFCTLSGTGDHCSGIRLRSQWHIDHLHHQTHFPRPSSPLHGNTDRGSIKGQWSLVIANRIS